MADYPHHALGDADGAPRDGTPSAVTRAVRVPRGVVRRPVAHSRLHDSELVVDSGMGTQQREQRVDQCQIDHHPFAALAALAQPPTRAEPPRHSGHAVGKTERWKGGRPVRLSCEVGETGHRLRQSSESATAGVGAELAEAGHAQHDQPWVDPVQLLRTQVPAFQDTGAEILDQDVVLSDQPLHHLLALRARELESDGQLVARDDLPPQSLTVLTEAMGTSGVTQRMLDLEDFGAEVAEEHGRERTGVDGRGVDDAQSVEWGGGESRW